MRNIFQKQAPGSPNPAEPEDVPTPPFEEDAVAPEIPAPDAALGALTAVCERLEKENADYKDQLLRRQAEFDNYRRRMERERVESRVSATMDTVMAVLPVLDGLEMALKVKAHAGGAEMRKGVELVEKQLREVLEKMGMTRIEAQGQTFDPRIHHAIEMVETDAHEDQTVLDVYQPGYMFQDRLLRPAMVRVACRPAAKESS